MHTDKSLLSYNALRRALKNSNSYRNAFKSDYCLKFHLKPGRIQPVIVICVQIIITNKSGVKIQKQFGNLQTVWVELWPFLLSRAYSAAPVLPLYYSSTSCLCYLLSWLIQASNPFNHQIPDHRLVYSNSPRLRVHLSDLETSALVYSLNLTA